MIKKLDKGELAVRIVVSILAIITIYVAIYFNSLDLPKVEGFKNF